MVLFDLAMVSLGKLKREQANGLVQAWYAKDAAKSDKTRMISAMARIIMEKEPEWRYYLDLKKSLLICKYSLTEANLAVLGEFIFRQSDKEKYTRSFTGRQQRCRECLRSVLGAVLLQNGAWPGLREAQRRCGRWLAVGKSCCAVGSAF